MSSLYWNILSQDDEMLKYRLKLEKLKERFDAAIVSNAVIVFMLFVINIANSKGETPLTPLLLVVLLAVYVPVSIWAYAKKQPILYIALAGLCLVLSFERLLMLVLAGLNVAYFFMTRGIIQLKQMPEYPHFLPKKTDNKESDYNHN